ncbi:MAG: glycosyltransferase [Bacteroidota bacterium]|nr:glycosyltransferase [Bacteroidota bacterium]
MLKNRDIVITGLQPWDIEIGSNCKNIALELSKNNRVLYVNAPMTRSSRIKEKNDPRIQKREKILKGEEKDIVEIKEKLWNLFPKTVLESINQLGINPLFDFLNKINNKRFAKQIKSATNRLGFKNIIHFTDSDMFRSFYLKELLKPDIYIYYTRDNLISMPYWKKQGIRVEAKHMKKADLVVANSTYLSNLAKKFNPNSHYVGQGCDVSQFDKKKVKNIPDDIKDIKKPIIGYIGALISLRLDIEIIYHIAKSKSDWSIVLVGPEDAKFKASKLHELDNVHFLGNKDGNELPSYLSAFDVALNPQILTELTIGNYPRKIDEYLAMGVPTVATKTEAMSIFKEHTYLAKNKEEYVELIQKALDENNSEKENSRSIFAQSHTWENNVKEIAKHIN